MSTFSFEKLIETRFADPITSLDLSTQWVCYGSAMGRIAFYSIKDGKDVALSDSQPELIRGISHSERGEHIFVSIGDISCQRLSSADLNVVDYVQIVENIEDRVHKANCERAFTLSYKHFNCVLTINMSDKDKQSPSENAPIMLSNLDTNMLESFGEPNQGPEGGSEVIFTQNCVPFDFDGARLLWMQYLSRESREVYVYDFAMKEKQTVLTFSKRDGIVSHMKFIGDSVFYVKDTKNLIKYDIKKKSSTLIGTTQDAVIALFVTPNLIREADRSEEEKVGFQNEHEIDEESKASDGRYTLCCLDESENIYVFKGGNETGKKSTTVISENIKRMGNLPQELREKDLFGMGYPYYATLYSNFIAFSSDYGVVLLRFDPKKL